MNALCYKIVFSKRLGALVVVGEHTAGQGKAAGTGVRSVVFPSALGDLAANFVGALKAIFVSVALTFITAGAATAAGPAANALPTGAQVQTGNVAISTTGANMTIKQATDKASVNWNSFSIGSGAKVDVQQNNANSVLLNRVVGNNPSQIFGQLTANGQVILINPNGVVFGKDSSVTASAFTASTFGMTEEDFKKGKHKFTRNGSTAGVTVEEGATINTTIPGGYVALIGSTVNNQGKISTQGGAVVLAAGESIALPSALTDSVGIPLSNKVRLELLPSTVDAMVANSGTITTEGGQVLMQAAAISDAVASITHTGTIDTTGEQGGAVTLQADHGIIKATGKIKANSKNAKNKGGDIYIGRDEITGVLAKATNVSGAKLESLGGFVETSGEYLETEAITVKAKDWLLDPTNIRIISSGTPSPATPSTSDAGTPPANTTFQDNNQAITESRISNTTIQSALNNGTNVKISTGLKGQTNDVGGQDGNIVVDADIIKSTGTKDVALTLEANNSITINKRIGATVTNTATDSGKLDVNLIAKGEAGNGANSAGVVLNSTGSIETNGKVDIDSTSKFSNGWDATRAALFMANGSKIIGSDLKFTLKATPTTTANRVMGMFAQNNTVIEATAGNINMDATLTQSAPVAGNTAVGILIGSGAGNAVSVKASGDIKLTSNVMDSSNDVSTNGISITDTKINAGGKVILRSNMKDASASAVSMGNSSIVAVSDVSITSDKGSIRLGLTAPSTGVAGIEANKLTISNIDNTTNDKTGASGSNAGVQVLGAAVKAKDAVVITGNSTGSGSAVNITSNVTGKSITIAGTSTGGTGIGGIGALNATAGNVKVDGTSTSNVGTNINNSITATGDVDVTGTSSTWHGLFSNGNILSTEGKITFVGKNTTSGAGLGMGGNGTMTAKGNIDLTGNSTGYFGISGFGKLTSTDGNITLIGTSDQSRGISFNNLVEAKKGVVTVDATTKGPTAGMSIVGTSGIEALSYVVKGKSNTNEGINQDGSMVYKSTSTTTTSLIEGSGSMGVRIYRGSLTIDSGEGKAIMRSAETSAGGVALGSVEKPGVTTKGDVTIGSKTNNAQLAVQRVNVNATGKLTLEGKAAGAGIYFQDGSSDPVTIVGTENTKIIIDGESTGSGTGVLMRVGANVSHKVETTGASGSISITGNSATGHGIETNNSNVIANGGASITMEGHSNSTTGFGSGVSIDKAVTATGGGAINITGTSAGTGSGIFLNTNGGAGNITADTGKVTLNGTATGTAGLGIYQTGTISGGSVEMTGISNAAQGVYSSSSGSITAKTGNAVVKGESTKAVATHLQSTVNGQTGVEIEGTSSNTTANSRSVLIENTITAETGNIKMTGRINGNTSDANQRAVTLVGGNSKLVAKDGNIDINADTFLINTGSATMVSAAGTGKGVVSINTTTEGRNVVLGSSDTVTNLGVDQGEIAKIAAQKLIIGNSTNGGAIHIETAINASHIDTLSLQTKSDKTITQTTTGTNSGSIAAKNVEIVSGNVTLNNANNNITTLAAKAASVNFVNNGALTIGEVNGTKGVATTGGASVITRTGNLTINENVSNNGTGDVILGAGTDAVANDGLDSNIKVGTTSANGKAKISNTGKTFLYTGSTSDTDKLEELNSTLANLDLSAINGGKQNADSNVTFKTGTTRNTITDGADVQVMFREKIKIGSLTGVEVSKTYGDANTKDTAQAALLVDTKTTLKGVTANQGNSEATEKSAGKIRIANAALIDTLNGSLTTQSTDFSTSKFLKANETNAYKYGALTSNKYDTSLAADQVTVKVQKLALEGSISTGKTVYGDETKTGDVSFTNKVGSDDIVALKRITVTDKTSTSGNLEAGTHTGIQDVHSLSGNDAGNYTFANVKGDYIVTQRKLTATDIAAVSTEYGTPAAAGAVTLNDVIKSTNGVTDQVTAKTAINGTSLSGSNNINAGAYTQSATGIEGKDAKNYEFTSFTTAGKTYTVTPKSLAASYLAKDKVFDGSAAADVTGTVAPITGDKVNVLHTSANFDSPDIGTAKTVTVSGISLSGADAANYKVDSTVNVGNTAKTKASITAVTPKPPVPVVPTDGNSRVKIPVGSGNPFALASAEDLADETCTANSIENCYCEPSELNKQVDICYEPKAGAKGSAR